MQLYFFKCNLFLYTFFLSIKYQFSQGKVCTNTLLKSCIVIESHLLNFYDVRCQNYPRTKEDNKK